MKLIVPAIGFLLTSLGEDQLIQRYLQLLTDGHHSLQTGMAAAPFNMANMGRRQPQRSSQIILAHAPSSPVVPDLPAHIGIIQNTSHPCFLFIIVLFVLSVKNKYAMIFSGVMCMSHLRSIRLARRLTQVAVYMATGIDQSLLSKYERGIRVPSTGDLLLLAELYRTSLDYLMERTDVIDPYPPKKQQF